MTRRPRRRGPRLLVAVAVVAAGCGGATKGPDLRADTVDRSWPPPREQLGEFDPYDPAYSLAPPPAAAEQQLLPLLGHRADFRVPAPVVAGMADGQLVRAVVARLFHERAPGSLSAGQRAVYALVRADTVLRRHGLAGLGAGRLPALAEAARRTGARRVATIYADAERVMRGARVGPDDLVALDERYAAEQADKRTALAPILARYVRAHASDFLTPGVGVATR